jgi:hypothetical protein
MTGYMVDLVAEDGNVIGTRHFLAPGDESAIATALDIAREGGAPYAELYGFGFTLCLEVA